MLEEVSRPLGRAAPFEIARRATHHEAVGRDAPGDQAQVGHRRVAYRQIEPFSHHVDHAFGHAEVDRYVGMEVRVFGNHRREERRDGDGSVQAQRPARRRVQRMRDAVCIVEIRQDLLATLVVGAADLGKADFARAAVEQSHAEPCLERMNVFGNGARRHAKGATGRGKATSVDDPHEGRHACRAVHQDPPVSIGQRGRFQAASRLHSFPSAFRFAKFQAFRCEEGWTSRVTARFPVARIILQLQRSPSLHAVDDSGGATIMAKRGDRHCQATRQCAGQLSRRQRMMDKLGNPGGCQ